LNDEQADRIQWGRHHNRFAHGSGRVCGLRVYAAPDRLRPWLIGICPGYAVSPCGDEIEVPSTTVIDIREFEWSRPHAAGILAAVAFVALRFAATLEEGDQPANIDCGCGCSSSPSAGEARLRDGYAIDILWRAERPRMQRFDLCNSGPAPCPPVPSDNYVILAAVHVPKLETTPLEDANIIEF
jgi:hypothetical protein